MKTLTKLTMLTIGFCAFFTIESQAKEEKIIQFNALPVVVQQSVLRYIKTDDIKKVELISDEGTVQYEIESLLNGTSMDISLAQNGMVLELENGSSFSELPAEAQAEVKKDYPDIKIDEVEFVQKFYYGIEGVSGGKKVQFKVLATGDIEDTAIENDQKD